MGFSWVWVGCLMGFDGFWKGFCYIVGASFACLSKKSAGIIRQNQAFPIGVAFPKVGKHQGPSNRQL